MDTTSKTPQVLLAAGLALLCALVMLVAFAALPWYELEDGGTVTGYRLALDTEDELELPVNASHMFLIVVPLAAVAAGLAALWELAAPRHDHTVPGLILIAGLVAVGYYYGSFFYEDRAANGSAFDFAEPGFYLALIAALGLVIQFVIPRPGSLTTVTVVPPRLSPVRKAQTIWGWPRAVLRTVLGWLRTVIGWALAQLGRVMSGTPVLAYLIGLLAAAELERRDALPYARLLDYRKQPSLFGADVVLEPFSKLDFTGILGPFFPKPNQTVEAPLRQSWEGIRHVAEAFANALSTQGPREPGFFKLLGEALTYDLVVYVIPILVVALLLRGLCIRVLRWLPGWVAQLLPFVILYLALSRWIILSDYRELVLMLMGVNIMLAVSLNLINGYMGEFSVGHAGFMGVGAYASSVITMWLFTDTSVFKGAPLLPTEWGLPVGFLVALFVGGAVAGLAGLLVAIPSFRTRGDYLAIVTLAVNFIFIGVINNINSIGGSRGLNGVPLWTDFKWVFVLTVLSVLAVRFLVNSTFGKGIIAVREDEVAAELMGVNTRHVKLVAFILSSFIAGVSGGLMAHVLAYVNPGNFDIKKSTEALVMVYLGGMGSISGSVIAGMLYTIMVEAFRSLDILKWIAIPLILILLMFYRPQGLFGFRELKINLGGNKPVAKPTPEEVRDDTAASD